MNSRPKSENSLGTSFMTTPDLPAASGVALATPSSSAAWIIPTAGVAEKATPEPLAGLKPTFTTLGSPSTRATMRLTRPNSGASASTVASIEAMPALAL